MTAKVLDKNGNTVEIAYTVDVQASAQVEWENDEYPSGWNYRTDSPTYTTSVYAASGEVVVSKVSFIDEGWVIGDDEVSMQQAQQHLNPESLRQLLNGQIYSKILGPLFDKATENMEPPDPDFDEPERDYDSRY